MPFRRRLLSDPPVTLEGCHELIQGTRGITPCYMPFCSLELRGLSPHAFTGCHDRLFGHRTRSTVVALESSFVGMYLPIYRYMIGQTHVSYI